MKIGALASALGVDATELAKAHNLAEDTESIDESILETVIKSHITEVQKSNFVKGKEEGKGWGTKTAMANIEKKFKDKFGIDANDLDTALNTIEAKMNTPGTSDEKTKRELEIQKEKNKLLQGEFEEFKSKTEFSTKKNQVVSKLQSFIPNHFEPGTPRLQQIAINDVLESIHFDIEEDGEVSLYENKERTKPLRIGDRYATLEDIAKTKMGEILTPLKAERKPPRAPGKSEDGHSPKGDTKEELLIEMTKAKTAEERNAIIEKLKKLESQ